jgi:CDP-6-deoxy-D-xylo-4-hexulose-3-dehydrase
MKLDWPLMENNIIREDLDVLIEFLKGNPILTQSTNVREFEKEWSDWLGVKYSLYVNSGSSANFLTMFAIKILYGVGEVIVPTLTWVSDIASVIQAGHKPIFVDIDPDNLCMNVDEVISKITPNTKAVFLTYVQGFNGLNDKLLNILKEKNIPLIEDVCESHGATFQNKRLGSFGLISNFSYYFAHHMSTIEGGMVCTDDENVYQILRMLRSHGMVREMTNETMKEDYKKENPELNPDFIFAFPSYNMRSTEIGGVLGRNQLKRLDANNIKRNENFKYFLENLDPSKFKVDFDIEGMSNYALNLVIKKPDLGFCTKVMEALTEAKVEFRRGSAGGGNQTRQPYLKGIIPEKHYLNFKNVEHIHFFGFYIGNYPDLKKEKIEKLCELLNSIN